MNLDLAFMLDSSGSAEGYFQDVVNVIERIIDNLHVGLKKAHVGFVVFSDNARVETSLHEYYDKDAIKSALKSLPSPSGSTRLDVALQITHRDMFSTPDVIKEKRPKFLFIVTDGVHSSPYGIDIAVQPLHMLGVKVFRTLYSI